MRTMQRKQLNPVVKRVYALVEQSNLKVAKKVLTEEIRAINYLRKEINKDRRGLNGKIIRPANGSERAELRRLRDEKKKYVRVKKHINAIIRGHRDG